MSLKYLDEVGLAENIAQEKLYIEGIRATLDAAKQDVIQVTNLGSATADKVGIAYQYMGTTTGSYKHGWFYEAVEVTPATDPATYTWQEFEFGGGLPYATTAPSNPENGDVFLYIGATNLTYKNGGIYQYNSGTQLYAWGNGYDFTLSETPSVNDTIYDSSGTATTNYVVSYDSVNDAIEDNYADIMARNSSKDKVVGAGWVLKNPYNIGDGLALDTLTNTLSANIATTHSLGAVKGGSGTYIGGYGEVNVYQRLREGSVDDPSSSIRINDYDSLFMINTSDYSGYIEGGIYKLQITEVTPAGTENPSEEGWYEYEGRQGDDRVYVLSEDTTVDNEKYYFTIEWVLMSANSTTFNTDDFDVVDDNVSLDVSQRTFTGTAAEWEDVVDKSIYTIVNLTDDEPAKAIPLYADMAVGTIVPFGGSTSVDGFLLCDGSEYNRTDYPELFEVIGTSFGTPSANTKFKVPDLREATTKGAGLTGLSNNHLDADGLALGEFIEDRILTHGHTYAYYLTSGDAPKEWGGLGSGYHDAVNTQSTNPTGSATNEVKAVGVNYLIKAKQIALPIDLQQQVDIAHTRFPDYARGSIFTTNNVSSYTCPEDCYVSYSFMTGTTDSHSSLQIDGVDVSAWNNTSNSAFEHFSGFAKKGSVLTRSGGGNFSTYTLKVFGLI